MLYGIWMKQTLSLLRQLRLSDQRAPTSKCYPLHQVTNIIVFFKTNYCGTRQDYLWNVQSFSNTRIKRLSQHVSWATSKHSVKVIWEGFLFWNPKFGFYQSYVNIYGHYFTAENRWFSFFHLKIVSRHRQGSLFYFSPNFIGKDVVIVLTPYLCFWFLSVTPLSRQTGHATIIR